MCGPCYEREGHVNAEQTLVLFMTLLGVKNNALCEVNFGREESGSTKPPHPQIQSSRTFPSQLRRHYNNMILVYFFNVPYTLRVVIPKRTSTGKYSTHVKPVF